MIVFEAEAQATRHIVISLFVFLSFIGFLVF